MADENINIVISAFDKTKTAFSSVTKSLGAVTGSILSTRNAIIAVAGATGFGYMVKSSISATDQLAKTAAKIGTTTEALSRLRYAADLTGVSTQTLDMAMQRFTRRVAEAARGTGEAKGALRELGIDASSFINLPLDKQILAVADAYDGLATSSDQVRISQKLFDSEGVALVNTLKLGSEGLREMMKEADTLGIVLSSNAAKGAERANDAMTKLGYLLKGIKDQFSAALAPAIEAAAGQLKDWAIQIAESEGGFAAFGRTLAADFLTGVQKAVVGLEFLANGFLAVYNSAREIKSWFTGEKFELKADFNFADEFNAKIEAFKKKVLETKDNVQELVDVIAKPTVPTFFEELKYKLEDISAAFVQAKESAFDFASDAMSFANNSINKVTDGLMDLFTGAKSAQEAFKAMAASIIQDLMRMYIKYMIVQPLFDALFPGARTGGGSTGSNANGGSVSAGQPRMVGENGPEMFIPRVNGAIVKNSDLGGGGGVTINQSINVSTGVQQTVRAEVMSLMPQIANATKAAVADARMRGGNYSKSLVGA